MRVLVVEDDAIAADLLEHALIEFGWDVATATNGREALELLRLEDFRLVISDWEMPQMNGHRALSAGPRTFCRSVHLYHLTDFAQWSGKCHRRARRGADEFLIQTVQCGRALCQTESGSTDSVVGEPRDDDL